MIPGLTLTWLASGGVPTRGRLVPRPARGSVGELSVKGHLDALDLVTQFDGRAQFQVHALLHGGQREQKQRLTVDVLQPRHQLDPCLTGTCRRVVVCVYLLLEDVGQRRTIGGVDEMDHFIHAPLQRVPVQHQLTFLLHLGTHPAQISILAYSDELAQLRRRLFTCISWSLGGWYWLPWL